MKVSIGELAIGSKLGRRKRTRRVFATGLVIAAFGWISASAEEGSSGSYVEEVVVTAQKREQSINDVGMSIDVATGEKLGDLGITDTADLGRVVSGFNANSNYYGSYVYTIRGIGFQDTALASSNTVSVSVDEIPIPFAAMSSGAILDLERLEALKGPQGTLFGQNSTGGAINFIANKPTSEFEAGVDAQYGRFNELDFSGFVSGPISETLSYRIAARSITSDGHQKSYTRGQGLGPDPIWVVNGRSYEIDREAGEKDFLNGRLSLQWDPNDRFSALLSVNAWKDESDSMRPQKFGTATLNPINTLNPLVANYPNAPKNNRDSDWGPCVNATGGTPANVTGNTDIEGNPENLNNRILDDCVEAAKDNDYWSVSLRMDWDVSENLTFTSLTNASEFDRFQGLEADGMIYQDYENLQRGDIEVFFQELRLSGGLGETGSWVAGVNFEHTESFDSFLHTYGISSAIPTQVITATPLGPIDIYSEQETDTWAVFGSVEYPIREDLFLTVGARYTDQQRDYRGCANDAGDGTWSTISDEIQIVLQLVGGHPVIGGAGLGPGGCATTGVAPTFHPEPNGYTDELDEDNFSWKVGLNYERDENSLYWFTVTQGYKSGSFPTVAAGSSRQLTPVVQEDLLAYELGTKLTLQEGRLQVNAAIYYYDYTDKQILGAVDDFVFGSLPALVNVPESNVKGAEFSIEWYPIDGLRIAPALTYVDSEITGTFRNFDPFFGPNNPDQKNFSGQPFPNSPEWLGNLDVEYAWQLNNGMTMFVGANMNYQDETHGFFVDECKETGVSCTSDAFASEVPLGDTDLEVNSRTLVDVRAGVEFGKWRVLAFGRNVGDEHYWDNASHVNDALLRFTGMPRTYGISVNYRTGG
ncbi:MAG: TonB-dependent receptor [Pseudomonadales bacterium]